MSMTFFPGRVGRRLPPLANFCPDAKPQEMVVGVPNSNHNPDFGVKNTSGKPGRQQQPEWEEFREDTETRRKEGNVDFEF